MFGLNKKGKGEFTMNPIEKEKLVKLCEKILSDDTRNLCGRGNITFDNNKMGLYFSDNYFVNVYSLDSRNKKHFLIKKFQLDDSGRKIIINMIETIRDSK